MLAQKEQSFEESNASSSAQQNTKSTAMENVSVWMDGIELMEFAASAQRDKNMTMDSKIAFPSALKIQYFKKHPKHVNVMKDTFCFMAIVKNVSQDKYFLQTGVFAIFPAESMNNLMETNACVNSDLI